MSAAVFRHWFALAALFALGAPRPGAAAPPDDLALRAAAAFYDGIRVETLPNGLRVFLKPVPGTATVTTMVAYNVGSADEELDATGLSHYLEHLMFKGTEKLLPGDIDRLTMRAGGRNNAYTDTDLTVFHFDFAADHWDAALRIEADRMRHLRIDEQHEFEQEKGAVVSELEMSEDQPFDVELKAVLPLLFGPKAPYGHPVIGERDHVRGATAAVIKGHYDRWYHPNNAALVVCGGFDPERVSARVRELFGPIPSAKLPPRKPAAAAGRAGPVRREVGSKFEVPRMVMGFNGARSGEADFYALEVVQALLSGGKTGRLYKKLVEGDAIASEVAASNTTGRYPGWFGVELELLKDKPRDRAEQLVLDELKRLADEPVGPDELRRVQRGLVSGFVFGRESIHDLADSIARGVTVNDLDFLRTYLAKVLAVTAADVQAAARKYFDPQRRVVVWSVPHEDKAGGAAGAAASRPCRPRRGPDAAAGGFTLGGTRRVVLPNGLTLLLLEDHRLPIVVADAFVKGTRLSEPAELAGVANLVGIMLNEGTAKRSGPLIATAIEDVGGTMAFSAAGGSVRVLAPDRALGLELLFDSVTHPNFPADALERKRTQTVSALDDDERRADYRAQRAFAERVYGPKHPLGRPQRGSRAVVAKLTADDCRHFHTARFVPNNTIVAVVGDFPADVVVAEITRLTADWKPAPPPAPGLPAVGLPARFEQTVIPVPESSQLYVELGHVGIRRNDPDYYKLLVMDYVLGLGTGFTDRLSAALRDRQGLAYTVSASITGNAGDAPGTFAGSIATFPDKLDEVKAGFVREITRIRAEAPSAEEVADAKSYLIGSLPFHAATVAGVAEQLLQVERFGLGLDYPEKFRAAVAAVTPADVLAAARAHLDPGRMVLVAAGPVAADGKPLAPRGK